MNEEAKKYIEHIAFAMGVTFEEALSWIKNVIESADPDKPFYSSGEPR